jgi:hypothetical protein
VFSKVWSVCVEIGDVRYCYELSGILDGRRFFVIKHTLFLELLLRLMLGPGPGSSTGGRLSIVKSFRSALPFNILFIPCWKSTLQKPIEPDYRRVLFRGVPLTNCTLRSTFCTAACRFATMLSSAFMSLFSLFLGTTHIRQDKREQLTEHVIFPKRTSYHRKRLAGGIQMLFPL